MCLARDATGRRTASASRMRREPLFRHRTYERRQACAAIILTFALSVPASVLAQAATPPDFTEFSLEALTNLEVISVSKRPERLNDAAAAIFVITADEIRRSGATSIPELLRMVPGLDVARIDANKWAVSARGFNGRFANKLLVLIDGRSVYEPLFSGVFWEAEGGAARRHRAHRGDPRTRRHALGRQRRQRRDQRHHAAQRPDPRGVHVGPGGHRGTVARRRTRRRRPGRSRHLPGDRSNSPDGTTRRTSPATPTAMAGMSAGRTAAPTGGSPREIN